MIRSYTTAAGVVTAAIVWLGVAHSPIRAADAANLALLVGCTEYRNQPGVRELHGPANDVPMWAALLTDPNGFAFPKENVTQLVGWPRDEATRPTYANIVKGFEGLIARAKPDSRVVIVLSGHGIQVPIPKTQKDPLDPRNPEPDGMDEVFLPADVEDWSDSGLKNAIRDDQIGTWLDRLRARGAHVLIVFDCCHSGTMTRGGPDVREISRVASPAALKIKEEAIWEATERARKAVADARAAGKPLPREAIVGPKRGLARGSLVAFYAAQPFEEAPELPFPEDATITRENYYGMLSWTLVQTLRSRRSLLTYGELQRLVAARYRSSRGARPPTPFAEGDLNREILGLTVWPDRPSFYIHKDRKRKLLIDAGQLHGLTPQSVLAVLPPPNDRRDPKTVLGHVKVTATTPSSATVVPVRRVERKHGSEWEEVPADAETIPDSARCEIVVRDFGDMGVKLFAKDGPVKAALGKLAPEVKQLVRSAPRETDAGWLLRVVSPEEARKEYGIGGLGGSQVFLVQGEGRVRLPGEKRTTAGPQSRKVFGQYPLADEKTLIGALERDLPKVFKWENLWRVASGMNEANGGESHGLVLEVLKLKDETDPKGEELRGGVLTDGDEVAFWVKNGPQHDLWVTAFYLDANLRIRTVFSSGVGRGKRVKLGQGQMNVAGNSAGLEGLIVFAIPQSVQRDQPNFSMLEQEPLHVPEAVKRGPSDAPSGPFGKLLRQAAFNQGTRSWEPRVSTAPAILSQSWVLIPGEADPRRLEQGGFLPRPDRPRLVLQPPDRIAHASPARDGEWMITVSTQGVARIWEAGTGRQVGEYGNQRKSGASDPRAAAYAYGTQLAVLFEGQVQRWNLASGKLIQTLANRDAITKLVKTGGPDAALLLGLAGGKLTPDRRMIWREVEGKLVLFDVAGPGKEIRAFDTIGTGYRIKTVAFSTDTQTVAAGLDNGTVALWDLWGKQRKRTWEGHSGAVVRVAFDRQGRHLLTAGSDRTFVRWELTTGKEARRWQVPEKLEYEQDLSLSVDGATALTRQLQPPAGWHLLVWDLGRGDRVATLKLGDYSLFPRFTADGDGVITPMRNAREKHPGSFLKVWVNPRDPKSPPVQREGYDYKADVHLGRKWLASPVVEKDGGGRVRVVINLRSWDNGELLRSLRANDAERTYLVRFSPDGKYLAADCSPLIVWESETGAVVLSLPSQWFNSWSADGRCLTTRESDRSEMEHFRLWDVAARKLVGDFRLADHISNGHWQLTALDLSGDGTRLLTAGIEGELRVWDAAKGKALKVIRAHGLPIVAAALSPDSRRVVSAAGDGVNLWDMESGTALRSFVLPTRTRVTAAGFIRNGKEVFLADETAVRLYPLDEN